MTVTKNKSYKYGIKLKTTLIIGLLSVIILLAVIIPGSNYLLNEKLNSSENNMRSIAKWIANAYIANNMYQQKNDNFDFNRLNVYLSTSISMNNELALVALFDSNKNLINGMVSREWYDYPDKVSQPETVKSALKNSLPANMKKISLYIEKDKDKLGDIIIYFSLKKIYADIKSFRIQTFIIGILSIIIICSMVYVLSSKMTKPLIKISDEMLKVENGDLERKIEDIKTNDEIELLAASFNNMIQGLKEREKLKKTFAMYVSKQVFLKIMKDKYLIQLGGEKKEVTVLFSDIRGFTSMSEKLAPEKVVSMLNRYFDRMLEIIFEYEGTLDKFMGDAIMAVYNAPIDIKYSELKAVYSGLGMLHALQKLNKEFVAENLPEIDIGIGINTGEVVAGNIGSRDKVEYTVIGDHVNLAQRLESATKQVRSKLLISETTYNKVKEYVEVKRLVPIKVKGKEKSINVYSVISVKDIKL